ncbi:MAG: T9SS type A sorting domain-containing protein [candidate division WOR-3 bacterium]
MKRLMIAAVALGLAYAQSPSEYLGIVLGQTAAFQGGWVQWDGTDSVNATTVDTESVANTFNYNGYEALSVWTAKHMTGDTALDTSYVDTFYNDPPWLRERLHITENNVVDAYIFRTPFVIGDKWSLGTEGKYTNDFDGDGQPDSILIRADTIFVEDTDTITVPAGTFYTYRLRREASALVFYFSLPMVDSATMTGKTHLWWSPGNWGVKDTSHNEIVVYVFGTPYTVTQDEWRELTSLVGVEESNRNKSVRLISPSVSPGMFWLARPERGLLEVSLYDPSGRLAMRVTSDGGTEMAVNAEALSPGVYFMRARLDGTAVLKEKIVKK